MATIQIGFALMANDGSVVKSWETPSDTPPSRIFIEGVIDIHGMRVGEVLENGYKLVPMIRDDTPPAMPWFSLHETTESYDGNSYTLTNIYSQTPNPTIVANAILGECARRIYAVASDNCQKNMLANMISGNITGTDVDTYKASVAWISSMQAAARTMAANADPNFAQDAKWPTCPPEVIALAAKY